MVDVIVVFPQTSSLIVLTLLIVGVNDLAIKTFYLFVEINKNVVGLNVSVNITKLMELLGCLEHLNAKLEDIHFLEVLLIFVENATQAFAKLVLNQKFRVVFNI